MRRNLCTAILGVVACFGMALPAALAHDEAESAPEEEAAEVELFDQTGRLYFMWQTGHVAVLDEDVAGDLELDTPDGLNLFLGGTVGYNVSRHWGFELQGQGTEPEIRSASIGKVKEFSNITIIPAVRYRHPLGDGRWVPYLIGGVGASLNDVNDSGDPKVKLRSDEISLVGTLATGIDYFVTENVSFGFGIHAYIYDDIDTELQVLPGNRRRQPPTSDESSLNLTSVAFLGHLRFFPGQGSSRGERRLLLADGGPFDSDEPRLYLYLLGGHTQGLDDEFGGFVELEAPGDVNWTLGGGVGMNFDGHWGAELQLFNQELNLAQGRLGKFAELSNFTIMPQVRYRHQLWGGRFVPFALAGVGASINSINDKRGAVDIFGAGSRRTPTLTVEETSIAGVVGVGFEYFLNRHFSLGFAVPFYIYPYLHTKVETGSSVKRGKVDLSGPAPMIRVSVYLP